MALPFALIVPGCSPITNFECSNGIFHADIFNPCQVANICVTLTQPLPQNFALTLSFSTPPYTAIQYLGAISNNRPSDIFPSGFPLKPDLMGMQSVKLCLRVQTFQQIVDLVTASDGRKEYSKLVAHNLYNFMMSYNRDNLLINGVSGDYLVIPSNCLEKWMLKFEEKYSKDPNFILKTTTQ